MSRYREDDGLDFDRWRAENSDLWDGHYLDRPLPQPAPPTMAELLKREPS